MAAGRAAQRSLAAHSIRRLPAGTVTPSLSVTNILEPEALRHAVSESLSAVGGSGRKRDVIAVLPDAAVRVLLLDFDTLPNDPDETAAIIRFRLKKSLPFDVEHCALSFDKVQSNGQVRTVVALSPANVVAEYEQLFHDAGYEASVVLPSVLATLGNLDPDRPAMLVKIDAETTSIVLADRAGLRLLRTLEHPAGHSANAELMTAVHASLIFYEDSFGQPVSRVLIAGTQADAAIAATIGQENEVQVAELTPGHPDGRLLAAVEGALLQ